MATDVQREPAAHDDDTYARILVPLDGSREAEATLRFAALLPARELTLLHVQDEDEVFIPDWIIDPESSPHEQTLRARIEQLAAELRADGRSAEVVFEPGDVAAQIITRGLDVDLIVMATHGRGAAGRLIFGSVADRVVRHGMTPTLLLRAGAHTEVPKLPSRIVVTLDGSPEAEQALPAAERLARTLEAPVLLARAVGLEEIQRTLRTEQEADEPPFVQSPDRYERARAATTAAATHYLEERVAALQADGITASSQVVEGSPAFSLMWAMTEDDIAVLTTHGTSGYKRWSIGSVAEKLVRQAPCPVLLMRIAREERQ
jgi:nucleotide-binding universal stress UspA family protein